MMTIFPWEADPLDRARPLREACALVDEARARGETAFVRVVGPPGIGKTTFLRFLVTSRHEAAQALWMAAEPIDRAYPGACMRRLAGHLRPNADEMTLLGEMRAAVRTHPVLCIDDVQWLDEISRRIVRTLAHECGGTLTLLVSDRREEAPELGAHRSVHLAPLRSSAAARLVREVYSGAPASVVEEIVTVSAGLPFDVVFLAEHAARAKARTREEAEASTGAAVARRLERCSTEAREALRHCACLEAPADLVVVSRAMRMELGTLTGALADVSDLATVEDLRLIFRHAAIARAVKFTVADTMPYYARLVGGTYADDERPEVLAIRLRCAQGCGADGVAAESAILLGRKLAASSSLEAALDHFALALRYAPRPLPPAYVADYAGVLQQLSRDEEAAIFVRRELDSALDRRDARTAADLLASFFSAALTLERFVELEALCSRVEFMLGGDSVSARRLRSVELAALAFSGRLDEYARLAAKSDLGWVDRRPESFVVALRGDATAARRAFETYHAGLHLEHARQEPSDQILRVTTALFNSGTKALDELESTDPRNRAHSTQTALRVLRRISDGRWKEASVLLDAVPVWDDTYQEAYGMLDVRLLHAALTRRQPTARGRTLAVLRSMIAGGQIRHAVSLARSYAVAITSDGGSLEPDLQSFVGETFMVMPMPYMLGALPLALALLVETYGAPQCQSALDAWPRLGSRWHRAHLDLAVGLASQDYDRLRAARDAFDVLNAPAFAMLAGVALPIPRARDLALANELELHGQARPRKPLTARERDVAELAASGKGNREIAATMRISERTVEVHLTNVFRKLGVRSRSALAHFLRREA